MGEWDAKAYGKFEKERIQPSIDLVRRIMIENPKKIIDIGCGSGMSTKVLANKWPEAEIMGIDNSNTMLEQAKRLGLNVEWIFKDCNESIKEFDKADIIFSNASLQWLKNQEQVIGDWFRNLNSGGVVAVQVPLFEQMKMRKCINEVSMQKKWQPYFKEVGSKNCYNYNPEAYYDIISKYSHQIEMWETDYYHILDSQKAIVEFCKSTGLRPYCNALNDEKLEAEFVNEILQQVKAYYKVQEDGKVLFKFKRLFIIATS
nr:methyltransferase domain-containing protein [uncultured Cellulosilyticum sp.]